MSGFDVPIRFRIGSQAFDAARVSNEILALKYCSTAFSNALKSIPNVVDGVTVRQIVITDDARALPFGTFGLSSERAVVQPDGTLLVGINPSLATEYQGRTLPVGEVVLHGLGHFTPAASAARAAGNRDAEEQAAVDVQNTLRREVGQSDYVRNGGTLSDRPWPYFYRDTPSGLNCFLAGTPIRMADGTEKPIEAVKAGDWVMSFDAAENGGRGGLVPGRVSRTFQNVTRTVIDLHGLKVTPGHHFLTGEGTFEAIAAILQKDGTVVTAEAVEVRARTNARVGSPEDKPVWVSFADPEDGRTRRALVRAGIPCMARAEDGALCSLAAVVEERWRGEILETGLVRVDGVDAPVHWPLGSSPLHLPLQRNHVVSLDGRPYVPEWIEGLSEEEDGLMEAVGDAGPRPIRSAPAPAGFRPTLAASNASPSNRRERRRAAALERVK